MYFSNPLKTLVILTLLANSLLVDANPIVGRAPDRAPTVEECKDQLDVPPGGTLFWSKLGREAKRAATTRDYLAGYKVMADMFRDQNWKNQFIGKDETIDADFRNHCSQALAEKSSGTAYVFLRDGSGTDWNQNSHWAQWEWPHLSPAITELIRIGPDESRKKWLRGAPPPPPPPPPKPANATPPEPAHPAPPHPPRRRETVQV